MRQAIIIWMRFIIFFSCTIQAQNFYSKKYNYTNGLDAEQIYYAFQNPTGHLYFATQKGIIIYDGYKFVNYFSKANKIQSNYYKAPYFYYEDGQGLYQLSTTRLWDNPKLIQKKIFTDSDPNNDHFKNLFVDSKNRIWCNDFKYIKFFKNNHLTVFKLPTTHNILNDTQFIEINSSTLWIRIGDKLYKWNEQENKLIELHFNFKNQKTIQHIEKDVNEVVLSYSDGEIIRLDLYTYQIKEKFYLPNQAKIKQKLGHLYLTAHNLYKKEKDSFINVFESKDYQLNTIYFNSKQNQYWISSEEGIYQLSNPNPSIQVYNLPVKNPKNEVIAFAEFQKSIFALDTDGAIWQQIDNFWENVSQLSASEYPIGFNVIDNKLYVITRQRIYVLNTNKMVPIHTISFQEKDEVVKMVLMQSNRVWVLFKNKPIKVYSYPEFKDQLHSFNHNIDFWQSNTWHDLIIDENKKIWLLGWMPKGFGINYYHEESNQFVDISIAALGNDKQLFIGDFYLKANTGNDHNLLASGIGGFNIINAKAKIIKKVDTHHYNFDDYVFNNIVQTKNGDIYLTSQNGLYLYLHDKKSIIKIDKADGLPDHNVSKGFLKLANDDLLIGARNQILLLKTNTLKIGQLTNSLEVTQILVNGKRKTIEEEIILQPKENNISIEFSNLSYLESNKVFYRYQINEDKWVSLGNRPVLQFNSLAPNTYKIKIEAYDQFQNIQSNDLTLKLVVKPTFVQSISFRILLLVLFLGITYVIFKFFVRHKLKEEKLKRKIQESKMELLRTQMNPHFIFNTLNSINSYIIQNQTKNASKYLQSFSKLMRLILENSTQKYISLDEELKTLKLYIDLESVRFDHSFTYHINVAEDLDTNASKVPPLIIQPFVENSIWHGLRHIDKEGNLKINCFIVEKSKLIIQIIDNGIGLEKSEYLNKNRLARRSYGIAITKKRLKLLNEENTITIQEIKENKDSGTIVTIALNIN